MVTLPEEFVATKYPGYFWHIKEQKLYTMKISGVLRPLSGPHKPNRYNHYIEGYQVSVQGKKRTFTLETLETLKKLKLTDSIIPVEKL